MSDPNTISVVLGPGDARAQLPREATLSVPNFMHGLTGPVEIPVDKLRASLADLTNKLSTLLADLKAVGGFELAQVQVAVELTAQGGVHLIGSLTTGAKGAIQLTFKPAAENSA